MDDLQNIPFLLSWYIREGDCLWANADQRLCGGGFLFVFFLGVFSWTTFQPLTITSQWVTGTRKIPPSKLQLTSVQLEILFWPLLENGYCEMSELSLHYLVIMALFICTAFVSIFYFLRPPAVLPAVNRSTVWNVQNVQIILHTIWFVEQVCIVNCCAAWILLDAHPSWDLFMSLLRNNCTKVQVYQTLLDCLLHYLPIFTKWHFIMSKFQGRLIYNRICFSYPFCRVLALW